MKHIDPGHAWYMKRLGFPQPEVEIGQTWANEFCAMSTVNGIFGDEILCVTLQPEPHEYTIDILMQPLAESSAYVPMVSEIPTYKQGMTIKEALCLWVLENGGNISNIL